MVAMATCMVRKRYTCQKNKIWISGYHFMILWKGFQNFDFFHKIWKPYLEWYTIVLGSEYLNKVFHHLHLQIPS